jgi:hypothetical protein
MLPIAAALRDELRAWAEHRADPRKQGVVVEDVVKGRGRDGGVEPLLELELEQVRADHLDALAVEAVTCELDHRRRPVDGDDMAAWQPLEQHLRHPAAAAAGVEHRLVAPQFKTPDNARAPRLLGCRDGVVARGIPVSGGHGCTLSRTHVHDPTWSLML